MMKRGLVIGKFMPLHYGHLALIRFAAERCDELIVSMSFRPEDPIPASQRQLWLKAECSRWAHVRVETSLDDFDREDLPIAERTYCWAQFIIGRFPKIDILFSSEEYGEPFAAHLGIPHESFDPQRKNIPISATLIRNHPMKYWDYLPQIVRPYFVKKICFYGPESTGKSTMALQMAEHYHTVSVPEVARELITTNDFNASDIIRIGHAQTERVKQKLRAANRLIFCDTDIITTAIYAQHYLGQIPPILAQLEKEVVYDHYFLFDIDVPWVSDGLRDLGEQRSMMLNVFRTELEKRGIRYRWVRGDYAARRQFLIQEIDGILQAPA